jgi:hypothetical protein
VNPRALQGDLGACQFASEHIGILSLTDYFTLIEMHAEDEKRRWKVIQLLRYLDKDLPDISVFYSHRRRGGVIFI